jgi:N-acyl-phosphatidylethanolamine-hydrolysing phospholipase D
MNTVRRAAALLAACCAGALLASCARVNPAYNPVQPHHRPEGFQNRYTSFEAKGLGELLRWRWQAFRQDLPPPPQTPTPRVPADVAFIRANAAAGAAMQPAITWVGHATMLVQAGGLNVLTDPVFSDRASPVSFLGPQRAQPPGLALNELPRIDLVLVSHNHYDHLDTASVQALNAQAGGPPLFIVPLGLKAWLADHGITNAVELDWWQSHRVGTADVALLPAQHWSGRGLTDRLATLWGGFAVFTPGLHWLYTGDTGYSKDFADIRAWLDKRPDGGSLDLALIPVGAYEPRWFMAQQHVNPAEAVQIHRDLAARQSVGVHWGTFNLTDEALDTPPRDLAAARRAQGVADDAFVVLAVGETRQIPARAPTPADPSRNSAPR